MEKVKVISVMCVFVVFLFVAAVGETAEVKIKVTNPLDEDREKETVSIDLKKLPYQIQKPSVYSEQPGKFVLCQVIDNDSDDKNDELVFQADFGPGQAQVFSISESNTVPEVNIIERTSAMFVPQRKDDFAWENDKIAFRVYGPELLRTELNSSGIDVWVKGVKYPVMKKMYSKGHDYYHSDNGEASDFYTVGESLGCGGLGAWHDNKLYRSGNFADWKIVANGPIRSVFELTYKPWQVGDIESGETKRISLDLGSNFNRIESCFDADVNNLVLAVGIVRSVNEGKAEFGTDKTWLSYWQKADGGNGSIGCAVILPVESARNESVTADNHNLLLGRLDDNRSIIYYAGACWNRKSEFDSQEKWLNYVRKKVRLIENPLKVELLTK